MDLKSEGIRKFIADQPEKLQTGPFAPELFCNNQKPIKWQIVHLLLTNKILFKTKQNEIKRNATDRKYEV